MDEPLRSRKSKMKKRSTEWDEEKIELAQELGLWGVVQRAGWSGLSAEDSGRLGGLLSARRRMRSTAEKAESKENSTFSDGN